MVMLVLVDGRGVEADTEIPVDETVVEGLVVPPVEFVPLPFPVFIGLLVVVVLPGFAEIEPDWPSELGEVLVDDGAAVVLVGCE